MSNAGFDSRLSEAERKFFESTEVANRRVAMGTFNRLRGAISGSNPPKPGTKPYALAGYKKTLSAPVRKAIVVTYVSAKGGVGKSTISSTTSIAVAGMRRQRGLWVDINVDGSGARELLDMTVHAEGASTVLDVVQKFRKQGKYSGPRERGITTPRDLTEILYRYPHAPDLWALPMPESDEEKHQFGADKLEVLEYVCRKFTECDMITFDCGTNMNLDPEAANHSPINAMAVQLGQQIVHVTHVDIGEKRPNWQMFKHTRQELLAFDEDKANRAIVVINQVDPASAYHADRLAQAIEDEMGLRVFQVPLCDTIKRADFNPHIDPEDPAKPWEPWYYWQSIFEIAAEIISRSSNSYVYPEDVDPSGKPFDQFALPDPEPTAQSNGANRRRKVVRFSAAGAIVAAVAGPAMANSAYAAGQGGQNSSTTAVTANSPTDHVDRTTSTTVGRTTTTRPAPAPAPADNVGPAASPSTTQEVSPTPGPPSTLGVVTTPALTVPKLPVLRTPAPTAPAEPATTVPPTTPASTSTVPLTTAAAPADAVASQPAAPSTSLPSLPSGQAVASPTTVGTAAPIESPSAASASPASQAASSVPANGVSSAAAAPADSAGPGAVAPSPAAAPAAPSQPAGNAQAAASGSSSRVLPGTGGAVLLQPPGQPPVVPINASPAAAVSSPAPASVPAAPVAGTRYEVTSADTQGAWGIARMAVESHLGRPATNAEISAYWRKVVISMKVTHPWVDGQTVDLVRAGVDHIVLPPLS